MKYKTAKEAITENPPHLLDYELDNDGQLILYYGIWEIRDEDTEEVYYTDIEPLP